MPTSFSSKPPVASVVLDAIHDANFETEAGPGVYDIHSPRIPSEQEIEERIYEILKKMDVEKV